MHLVLLPPQIKNIKEIKTENRTRESNTVLKDGEQTAKWQLAE